MALLLAAGAAGPAGSLLPINICDVKESLFLVAVNKSPKGCCNCWLVTPHFCLQVFYCLSFSTFFLIFSS